MRMAMDMSAFILGIQMFVGMLPLLPEKEQPPETQHHQRDPDEQFGGPLE